MKLRDFIQLFFDGDDDKVYIDLYAGASFNLIFSDIRIINGRLEEYYDREVIGLFENKRLSIIVEPKVNN